MCRLLHVQYVCTVLYLHSSLPVNIILCKYCTTIDKTVAKVEWCKALNGSSSCAWFPWPVVIDSNAVLACMTPWANLTFCLQSLHKCQHGWLPFLPTWGTTPGPMWYLFKSSFGIGLVWCPKHSIRWQNIHYHYALPVTVFLALVLESHCWTGSITLTLLQFGISILPKYQLKHYKKPLPIWPPLRSC